MDHLFTTSNTLFVIGIIGTLFGIYRYFRDPQVQSEKVDALMKQQMEWFITSTEKRFNQMQENFNQLLLQSNNHIHTVDTKVDKLSAGASETNIQIAKLATIIEERMPKK